MTLANQRLNCKSFSVGAGDRREWYGQNEECEAFTPCSNLRPLAQQIRVGFGDQIKFGSFALLVEQGPPDCIQI